MSSCGSYHVALSPGCLIDDRKGPDAEAYCIPKVGGRALLSSACRVDDGETGKLGVMCPGCAGGMSFIASTPTLKAHAGDKESIVYIFGCLEEGCGGSKGSWRAFRWTDRGSPVDEEIGNTQAPEGRSEPSTSPKLPSRSPSHAAGCASSSWGLDDESLDDPFDLTDLSQQLHDLMTTKTTTNEKSNQQGSAGRTKPAKKETKEASKTRTTTVEAFEGRIPAFYLVHSADIPPTMGIDSEDEEEARYGSRYENTASVEKYKTSGEEHDGADVDEWGGEAYERDAVIRTGKQQNTSTSLNDEAAFVAYMKELSRVPDQCLRVYGGGAGVPYAWPTNRPDISSSCSKCGAARRCAVQVMSPLIVAMAEGLEMARELPKGTARETTSETNETNEPALCGPPSSWDWATLAVSVCSKSCMGDGGLIEEDVRVLGEA